VELERRIRYRIHETYHITDSEHTLTGGGKESCPARVIKGIKIIEAKMKRHIPETQVERRIQVCLRNWTKTEKFRAKPENELRNQIERKSNLTSEQYELDRKMKEGAA
jgi:hypothetical protein